MAKKYLSLEEAAQRLGVKNEEIVRLREAGEIRGYKDRESWKFKAEDVDEYRRSRQTDSDPEVPLLRDDESVLGSDDDSAAGRGVGRPPVAPSDSDVRLILDESLTAAADSEADVPVPGAIDSDSDVSLIDEAESHVDAGSDSDVKLVGSDSDSDVAMTGELGQPADGSSDSDVKLVGADTEADVAQSGQPGEASSDSDVKLVGSDSDSDVAMSDEPQQKEGGGSDSDVELSQPDSDSDIALAPEKGGKPEWEIRSDSDVRLIADEESAAPKSDSDVSLAPAEEKPAAAEATGGDEASVFSDEEASEEADSGIALEVGDSGIALEDDTDSGISLGNAADSGIALEDLADSGISLADESEDDFLALKDDSGIAMEPDKSGTDELEVTVPMVDSADGEDDTGDTHAEVPVLEEGESEGYDLVSDGDSGDDADTSVMLFDEEEDEETPAIAAAEEESTGETMEADAFEIEDTGDEFGAFDDDLQVAEDILGGEEEVEELDVFDAGDEDFEGTFETGESEAEFMAPPVSRVAAPVEVDWGAPVFVGLAASTALMAVCSLLMFDLIRTMWAWDEPYAFSSFLLDTFGGLF